PEQRDAEAQRQRGGAHGLRVLPRQPKDEFVGEECPLRVPRVEQPRLRDADTRWPDALRNADRLLDRQHRLAAAIGGAVTPVAELAEERGDAKRCRQAYPAARLAAIADGERDGEQRARPVAEQQIG